MYNSVRSILTAVAFTLALCSGTGQSTRDSACPDLEQCLCEALESGLRVNCTRDLEDLPRDLAKLTNRKVVSLALSRLNMTVLPAFYFANITTKSLSIVYCMLDSLDNDAFVGLGRRMLKRLSLSRNRLTTVPRALRALEGVTRLFLERNHIRVLGDELAPLSGSLHSLSLSRNSITTVHEEAFKDMKQLRKLWLSRNNIRDIPATLFGTTPALEVLDLSNNFISNIGSALNKLQNLKEVNLKTNKLENIYKFAAHQFPSLKSLVLDDNPITTITAFGSTNIETLSLRACNVSSVNPAAFAHLASLRSLDLSQNSIRHINGGAFHRLTQLSRFNASDNSITSLEGTFSRTRQLEALHLRENKIRDISKAFSGLVFLKKLDLKKNEIECIPDDTFPTNGDLRRIDLGENKISWLGRNCFQGLVSLSYLSMESNRVMSLNGSLSHMPTLQYLHVQGNRLRALDERDFLNDPRLKKLRAFQNQLVDVRGAFKRLQSLRELQLQNNSLNTLHRASFPAAPIALPLLSIADNPLICDCRLSWLTELSSGVITDDPICEGPPRLMGVPLLNSTTADTLHDWPEDCDNRCTCTCQEDDNYGKYTYVNCSNANLRLPPDTFPEDTYVVDLTMNRLESLSDSFADSVPRLQSLLLGHNVITSLNAERIPTGLRNLSIRNNRFTRFPLNIVTKFNLTSLSLSANPWGCDCEDYPFRQWAGRHERIITDAGSIVCAEGANLRVSLKPFMTLQQRDLCPSTTTLLISYGVTALVLLTLGFCLTVVYLKRERQIKVWLYAHGMRWVKESDVDKDKVFDVFLSFSSKDSDWAYANLVPGVEKAGFSVCTYDRNFKGGFLLTDIIKEAVDSSRRTLLLLTENFVQSEWCRWEFRLAHHKALEDKINRLIVVVPESVPEGVDEDLALYVEVSNYLRWGEKHFWNKLMYSLPKICETRETLADSANASLIVTYRQHP